MRLSKITALAAALTMTAAVGLSSYGAIKYNSSDAVHLRDALLGIAQPVAADDVNADSIVDSFDLCEMRRSLGGSTGEFTEQSFPASDNYVKIMGRSYSADDVTWLVQSGSAVEFTVTGKSAQITLAGDGGIYNGEDYRPRYAVLVDGEIISDTTMSSEELTVELFDGAASRSAKVKVILISEAMYGAVGVKNITVNSDSAIPVVPTKKNDLSIEFIGDSITCAYGVEGQSSYEAFKTTTENFMKSYAYLTAEKLGADYSAVCYSGHGIISGYTSSGDKNLDSLIPDCYGVASKFGDYGVDWDFSSQSHDVVVINLGTNDSGYVSADMENRSEEFIEGYIDFLETVREKNPDAFIICTLGTMGCEDVYVLVEEAANRYSEESGDSRIMSYQSVTQNFQADGIGSDWHPSAVTQQNSAYVLADKICQALGLESDQIGLDVAADAVYDVAIDASTGANASFFVGYDKSFWINMVMGSDAPGAIEAQLSGIGLKKDGGYRLEFDYTTTVDVTVPVQVRSSDGSAVYFKDEVSAGSEKLHFSQEFTVSAADENALIAFQLGGTDYYNITLSNIKLVKIS